MVYLASVANVSHTMGVVKDVVSSEKGAVSLDRVVMASGVAEPDASTGTLATSDVQGLSAPAIYLLVTCVMFLAVVVLAIINMYIGES